MSKAASGVDTLAKIRKLLQDNLDAVKAERLNATSKQFADMAVLLTEGPSRADGWLRIVDAIRQIYKLMLAIDGADADRLLADVQHQMDELVSARTRAGGLVQ